MKLQHKQSEYAIISPDDFTKFINKKTKNCKAAHEYFKVVSDIIGAHNVFFINHNRRKYYLSDTNLRDGIYQEMYPLRYIYISMASYNKFWDKYRGDSFDWFIGGNPKNWNWKFGVLKNILKS